MIDSRMGLERIIAVCAGGRQPSMWPRRATFRLVLACCGALGAPGHLDARAEGALVNAPRHAIAMHGEPASPANFAHMPYANPDAPKGGRLVFGIIGTFDSLNPLIVRGVTLQQIRGYV